MVVLAASACGCSTSDEKREPVVRTVIVERETPPEAKKTCAAPVTLPDRRLSEPETQSYWGADRTALRVCEARRAAAVSPAVTTTGAGE